MSDNPQTMTIDGRVHTYMTNAFVDEAEGLIAALVEKGVPGKLRLGRSYITRSPVPKTRQKHAARRGGAIRLGILEIWMVREIEEADQTYRPSPPTL